MLVQNLLNGKDIVCRAHKRVSNKVDIFLYCQQNVLIVLLSQSRQSDVFSRNVHTLVCSKHAVVLHLSHNGRTFYVHDLHVQFAIVEENVVTYLHVLCYVGIAKIHDVMTGVHVRASENLHHVSGLILYRLIHTRRADLRTFRIYHQCDVRRHRSHIFYYSTYPVRSGMGSIHADHIHSSEKQLANEVDVTPAVTD